MCACTLTGFSHVRLLLAPWTIAHQAPLEFSRQERWSRLPCPLPEDLPDPGIELVSLMTLTLAGGLFTVRTPGKPFVTRRVTQFFFFF